VTGAILIDTAETWPGAFLFFLTAAIAICVIGEWILGRRWGEESLPWAAVIAASVLGAVVGSKIYMSQMEAWGPALGAGVLPEVHGKNLLGAVAGTLVATWGLRGLLGVRPRFEDALGLVLPVAILVGRFGCFFAGCCHGTAADVPWAMRYGAGSIAHRQHVAEGLLAPVAAGSLAIHPAQLYEILLMAPLIAGVFWAHRRLKRRGSTLLVTLIGYGAIRFGQEFLRYGGEVQLGLKPVQWALLVVVCLAAMALSLRERSPAPVTTKPAVPVAGWRLTVLSTLGVLAVWMAWTWFGPGERFCVLLACVPLAWHTMEILSARFVPSLSPRWRRLVPVSVTMVALGAWAPLVNTEKKPPDQKHVFKVEVGAGGGRQHYEVGGTCEEPPRVYTDEVATMEGTIAYQGHLSDRLYVEAGLKGYGATIGRSIGPPEGVEDGRGRFNIPAIVPEARVPYRIIGAEPWVGVEGYWAALYLGVHIYGSPELDPGRVFGMVAAKGRLFPTDIFFLETMFLHDTVMITGPPLRGGIGFTLGSLGSMRMGMGFWPGDIIFYLQPDLSFRVGELELFVSPEIYLGASGVRNAYTINGTLGITFPLD